ncbi:MAG: coagulation factor 5/8 type domain protein, partial [Frankiales bacterium]|nr:coagulation factor 5/8 type domain protein [Frankiales bacterium]
MFPASLRARLRAAAMTTVAGVVLAVAPGALLAGPASAATTGAGAPVPFTEYLAAAAQTNGIVLGPDYYFGSLASEATGRQAVQLIGQG